DQIGGPRLDLEAGAAKAGRAALPEAERRRGLQRYAHHPFEHVTVAVPANARTGIIAREEHVDEVLRLHSGDGRGAFAQRLQPVGDRLSPGEARVIEVVAPAEALRLAVAEPAVEAERRQLEQHQAVDELFLVRLGDDLLFILETADQRLVEQQAHAPNSSLSSDGRSSG